MHRKALFAGLLVAAVFAQSGQPPESKNPPAPRSGSRTRLDASAQRNENVAIYLIDNNAIKEMNVRLGNTVTLVPEPAAETNYFGTEHGRPAAESPFLAASARPSTWHGELFGWHQNSVFNARTFFQVGPVKPSHRNHYGARVSGLLLKDWAFTAAAAQRKVRGMVNGNVLVPLADERTPLTNDPLLRPLVERFLAAYPAELPNRPDFDPRALNTNSPQRTDDIDLSWRADRRVNTRARLDLSHALTRQRIDAFQLVAGQNPDTEIHTHRSRATWRQSLSPGSELVLGAGFNRTRSLLTSEPNAVGPRVRIGYQIEELGPDSQFPINRALNSYRCGALWTRQAGQGRHALTAGGDLTRLHLNGIETNNQRPQLQFSNNFGRTAIQNLRMGTPTGFEMTIGELSRGYRNWSANAFFGDRWKLSERWQIYYGVRYNLVSTPAEVRRQEEIPYACDCNNFSPRFSVAWRGPRGWVMRASYTTSFGEILPVTYQQIRNNLPGVRYVQVQNPDLRVYLRGGNYGTARTSPTVFSPDMVSPYVHQYNLSLENRIGGRYLLRLGYVGSRSFKLLNVYIQNRGEPVAGIPLTLDTVDRRRPDARYYDVRRILNGGIAYLDAGQVSLQMPARRGFTWAAGYTFGKAIDEGPDYAFTSANRDLTSGRSQWQYDSAKDKKGLSTFDSAHALLIWYAYDLPKPATGWRPAAWLAAGWQVSGITMLKSGTPLTLYVGSDAPGFGNVDGGPSDRPHILDPSILGTSFGDPNTAPLILRRDRFAYIREGERQGSLGRNTFRKSGIANFNLALTKQWRWSGKREWTALVRGEAYNLTNHPQFDEPQRNLSSPSFGRITNTLNDGRVLQIGFRLVM